MSTSFSGSNLGGSSASIGLYFYVTQPKDPISWLSLVGRPKSCLLDGYIQSFKRFKERFFWVGMTSTVRCLYFHGANHKKFPFHWTSSPLKLTEMSKDLLSSKSRKIMDVLERLPSKVLGKRIVFCYLTDRPDRDVCGTFFMACFSTCSNMKNLCFYRWHGSTFQEKKGLRGISLQSFEIKWLKLPGGKGNIRYLTCLCLFWAWNHSIFWEKLYIWIIQKCNYWWRIFDLLGEILLGFGIWRKLFGWPGRAFIHV